MNPKPSENARDAAREAGRLLQPPPEDTERETKRSLASTLRMVGGMGDETAAAADGIAQATPAETPDPPSQGMLGAPEEAAPVGTPPDGSCADSITEPQESAAEIAPAGVHSVDFAPRFDSSVPGIAGSDSMDSPAIDSFDADPEASRAPASLESISNDDLPIDNSIVADAGEDPPGLGPAPPADAAYSPAAWTSPGDEPIAPDPAFEAAIAAADAGDPSPPGFPVEQQDNWQSQRGARSSPPFDASLPEGVRTSITEGPFIEHPPSLRGSSAAGEKLTIEIESSIANVQKNSVLAVLAMESELLKLIDKAGEQERSDAYARESHRRAVWGK